MQIISATSALPINILADDITNVIKNNNNNKNWSISTAKTNTVYQAERRTQPKKNWQKKRGGWNRWKEEQRISLPTYCEYSNYTPVWSNLCL